MCARRAMNCYENNGWKVKADLEKLTSQSWFDNEVNPNDLAGFVESTSQGAIDLLHGPSEQCVAIISNVHQSGKGFHAYRDHKHSYSVRLGLYKTKQQPKAGCYVKLTLSAKDGTVIAASPCEAVDMNDVDVERGQIKVVEKGFGFVNGVFVPPHLITSGINEERVEIVKIFDFDKTKNKPSWRAITLELVLSS